MVAKVAEQNDVNPRKTKQQHKQHQFIDLGFSISHEDVSKCKLHQTKALHISGATAIPPELQPPLKQ